MNTAKSNHACSHARLIRLKFIFFKHSLGQILGHHCCLEVAAVNLLFLALHRPSFVTDLYKVLGRLSI